MSYPGIPINKSVGADRNTTVGSMRLFPFSTDCIVKVKDHCMMLEDFKRKFFNYMRFKHRNVKYNWAQDLSAFKQLLWSLKPLVAPSSSCWINGQTGLTSLPHWLE